MKSIADFHECVLEINRFIYLILLYNLADMDISIMPELRVIFKQTVNVVVIRL